MSYRRFATMIVVSTIVMFGLMYLNTFSSDHIFYSQTRTWMAVLMGAAMAAIMIGIMWSMYARRQWNVGIVISAIAAFTVSLWLVRS